MGELETVVLEKSLEVPITVEEDCLLLEPLSDEGSQVIVVRDISVFEFWGFLRELICFETFSEYSETNVLQYSIFKALVLLVMGGGGEADALDMLGEVLELLGVREDVLICFIEHEELTLLHLEIQIAVILDSFTKLCYLP